MRAVFTAAAVLLLAGLAACSSSGLACGNPPVSSAPGSGPQQPQPAGSLPPGAVVNAPIAPSGGELLTVGGGGEC